MESRNLLSQQSPIDSTNAEVLIDLTGETGKLPIDSESYVSESTCEHESQCPRNINTDSSNDKSYTQNSQNLDLGDSIELTTNSTTFELPSVSVQAENPEDLHVETPSIFNDQQTQEQTDEAVRKLKSKKSVFFVQGPSLRS